MWWMDHNWIHPRTVRFDSPSILVSKRIDEGFHQTKKPVGIESPIAEKCVTPIYREKIPKNVSSESATYHPSSLLHEPPQHDRHDASTHFFHLLHYWYHASPYYGYQHSIEKTQIDNIDGFIPLNSTTEHCTHFRRARPVKSLSKELISFGILI